MDPDKIVFFTEAPDSFTARGSIVKIKTLGILGKIFLMRRLRPEYLFGNGSVVDIPFIMCKPSGTRYVIAWHTLLLRNENYWRVRTPWFVRRFVFNSAFSVLCVSEYIASTVRRYFPSARITAILNGVDTALFDPVKKNTGYLKEKYALDCARPIVAYVGTLVPRKRPDIFFACARRVPEADFVMVGRAVPPDDFLTEMRTIPNIRWIPSMSREDVAVFLASSSVFLFPSINEPAAAVILESMASGCVPVVSQSGGNGEFFTDGLSGFAVPCAAGEVYNCIQKIKLLLSDAAKRAGMAESARHEAVLHSWDTVSLAYADYFK